MRDYGRKSGLYGQEKASISSCGVLFVTRPHITLFFGESPPVLGGLRKIPSYNPRYSILLFMGKSAYDEIIFSACLLQVP